MNKKVVEYILVEGDTETLTQKVANWIAQGWEPLGGVAAVANKPAVGRLDCTYVQAMIKCELVSPPPIPSPLVATVECPQCSASISLQKIKKGANICPACKQEFVAE